MNLDKRIFQFVMPMLFSIAYAAASSATVSTFLSAGNTCSGAPTSAFTVGTSVRVSVCATTTSEQLCGYTIKLQASFGQDSRFSFLGLSGGGAGSNFQMSRYDTAATPIVFVPIGTNSAGYGVNARTATGLPLAAGGPYLLASFDIVPQSTAVSPPYVLSLSPVSMVASGASGSCVALVDTLVTASFSLTP